MLYFHNSIRSQLINLKNKVIEYRHPISYPVLLMQLHLNPLHQSIKQVICSVGD